MAGLTPVLGTLSTAITGLTAVSSAFSSFTSATTAEEAERQQLRSQQQLALQQLQAKQENQTNELIAQTELERQKIDADTAAAEDARQAALRRAVARQRTQFAAQGISSADGGSTEAVLLGLFDESEEEQAERERLDSIRYAALDQDLQAKNSLNILQQTQLLEQQKLQSQLSKL